jgi:tetratricopeptide (TPR) repeat protein
VGNRDSLSKEYLAAEKGLDDPERTNLSFARWKEDMGQYQEAKGRYREILTANPDNLPARMGIARIEFETGRVTEAQKILLDAAQRHPNSSDVWLELGRIQAGQEKWNESVASFQKAADIDSTDQVARYELGIALARGNQLEQALPHLEYSVGESAALYNIGYVLQEQNRRDEAIAWFERALQAHPDERTKGQSQQMLARLGVNPELNATQRIAAQTPRRSAAKPANPFATVSQPAQPASSVVSAQVRTETETQITPSQLEPPHWTNTPDPQPARRNIQPAAASNIESGRASYSFQETPQWNGPQQNSAAATATPGTVEPQQWRRD